MAEKKFYVVWKGRKTGVFTTWAQTAEQVSGYAGAQFMGFASRAEAELALRLGYAAAVEHRTQPRDFSILPAASRPLPDSYCVDAACSGSPGPVEYRCVHTRTRDLIFHQGPFAEGTNNVGEFLGLVHALSYFLQNGIVQPVYTDSHNAMLWVRQKKCKTRLIPTEKNRPLFDLIDRAEKWLNANQYTTRILKWDTAAWGEIPADFGRK